jgi:hypothetical protein
VLGHQIQHSTWEIDIKLILKIRTRTIPKRHRFSCNMTFRKWRKIPPDMILRIKRHQLWILRYLTVTRILPSRGTHTPAKDLAARRTTPSPSNHISSTSDLTFAPWKRQAYDYNIIKTGLSYFSFIWMIDRPRSLNSPDFPFPAFFRSAQK